jgi:hypothetical protein
MAPKKVTKGALKRGERSNPTGPRPENVVESVNPADLSTEEVPFDAVGSQQPVATSATITMADFDKDDDDYDDDVSSRFNPPQIRTRSETMATRRFVEAAGLMGSETSVPSLFGGQTGASTAVGKILGNNVGRFGSRVDEQTLPNDPLAHGDPFSHNQGRTDSGFGHQGGEHPATERDGGRFVSGLGVPQVDYRHYQSGTAVTTPPYLSAGIDLRGSGGEQFRSAAQTGTGIFKNAFANQWTADMDDPLPEDTPPRTEIINHFIKICGFSHDSLMVRYINQQQWSELAHIVMHGLEDSKSFEVFRDDGITTRGSQC